MTGVDAHGLLREQIAAVFNGFDTYGAVCGSYDEVTYKVLSIVEAAIAAARRDAWNEGWNASAIAANHGLRIPANPYLRARAAEGEAERPAGTCASCGLDWEGHLTTECGDNPQRARAAVDLPAELCEHGCGEAAHPHRTSPPAEGWEDADVADFLARDRAARTAVTHEFVSGLADANFCGHWFHVAGGHCDMPVDHPIHQTPEEPPATHEFVIGATPGHDFCQHVVGYGPGGTYGTVTSRIICGQRVDHPIHRATPEDN